MTQNNETAQLAGTVEYIDCISTEEYDSSNMCPGYDIKHFDGEAPVILDLVSWVLWHITLCRLFNTKSIFIQIINSISNNSGYHVKTVSFQTIQFSISMQFECQNFYFSQFSLA